MRIRLLNKRNQWTMKSLFILITRSKEIFPPIVQRSIDPQVRADLLFALNPFVPNPHEEKFSDDFTKQRKVHYESIWETTQDAVYWINLGQAQDQDEGLQLWQTRSHAVIACSFVPAYCI